MSIPPGCLFSASNVTARLLAVQYSWILQRLACGYVVAPLDAKSALT